MALSGRLLLILLVLALAAGGGWVWWRDQQERLPDHIAAGNGRIEAEEVQVATRYAGRVDEVLVGEGDLVEAGQVLGRMDTAELEAAMARAQADIAQARERVAEARAQIALRQSELTFARQELERARTLQERGHGTAERVDRAQAEFGTAEAALAAARASLATTERGVEAAQAEARRIQTQLDDAVLTAPRAGRVLYRLAEPGEVLAGGGRVLTLLDLSDVYMTIFLPTGQAGRTRVGSEARIVLDAVPQFVIPAAVSFVSPESQFTPRQVETESEREKLMFRVKVKIAPDLLKAHIEKVKTGLPGVAYVMLADGGPWPEGLEVTLPPAEER